MLQRISFSFVMSLIFVSCVSPQEGTVSRSPNNEAERPINYPPKSFENGFVILDVLEPTKYSSKDPSKVIEPIMYPEDMAKVKELKLEAFKPLYDFKPQKKAKDSQEPWLNQNLDVTKKEDAEKLAKILQKYVYEGWFAQDKTKGKMDYDKHFRKNKERTWCQTPWLNVTEKGREAIHGLTKEFPISSNEVYKIPEEIEKKELAVTWGVAFFNRPVCDGYDKFFHPSKYDSSVKDYEEGIAKMIREKKPKFDAADGAVSMKLLFNAMEDWPQNMKGQWDGAYNWNVHVSHARQNDKAKDGDESLRQIMNVAHVQMDIGFKDSRVKGTKAALKNWAMLTFYFDPNYSGNELLADMNIPEALKHMRPLGLQYGLEAGESHIFSGARNNHRPEGVELPFDKTRLNGPVDNASSSCLGCHALSGVNFGLPEKPGGGPQFAPSLGFMTDAEYQRYLSMGSGGHFDFDMQLDKAMRNFSAAKKIKIFPENKK